MKLKVSAFSLAVLFCIPVLVWAEGVSSAKRYAHKTEIKKKMEKKKKKKPEFHRALENKSTRQRKEENKPGLNIPYRRRNVFEQKLRQENLVFLQEKLADNKIITQEQKKKLVNYFENLYPGGASLRQPQYKEDISFFEQIAANPNLTQEEKKMAILVNFQIKKEKTEESYQQQGLKAKSGNENGRFP